MEEKNIYTQKELIERGWSEEKIVFFLNKPFWMDNKKGWSSKKIEKVEKFKEFNDFLGIEHYTELKKKLDQQSLEKTQNTIDFLKNTPLLNDEKSLLKKYTDYFENGRLKEEIFHYVNEEKLKTSDSLRLYTDGCLIKIGSEKRVICSGWIQDSNGQILVEFAKEIKPENEYDFEIHAIEEGLKLLKKLNLKNVDCFTDSSSEAKNLTYTVNGLTQNRAFELPQIYNPLIEILKETGSFISYMPRQYNQHADSLNKIHANYYKNCEKNFIEQEKENILKNGFDYSLDKDSYFIHEKVKLFESWENLQEKSKWFLSTNYDRETQNFYNYLINTQNNEFHLIGKVDKKNIKDIGQKLEIQSHSPETLHILNLCQCLEMLKDITKISFNPTTDGFAVVMSNRIKIPQPLKKEYYYLHQLLNQFESASVVQAPEQIKNKIKLDINQYRPVETFNKKLKI